MHEDNKFGRCGRTPLWISDHILHRALLSLPSPSSGYGRRNREGGRMPSPIVTKKLKEETAETEEMGESEGETDVEIETISETKGTKQEEGSIEEDPSPSLCSEENSKLEILKLKEDKDLLYHKLL
ncbi:hypothetical protein C5167_010976 [Papaver somniferum]|uniref:Uncharacterized protein n=1 Tax=Papaver somniferum TaxID=3469 RepID=A0A4Y7K1Q8_PAPSO|nr:hypothetical protein C5167_010976 [Papaver somniferum]